jgi:hypothetical protein
MCFDCYKSVLVTSFMHELFLLYMYNRLVRQEYVVKLFIQTDESRMTNLDISDQVFESKFCIPIYNDYQ